MNHPVEEPLAADNEMAAGEDALEPQPTAIDSCLFRLLFTCAHRVGVETMARIDVGESLVGLIVLQLLAGPRPPLSAREVAGALGCSRAAATQTLDRLERRGLISRARDTWDSRVKVVSLTPEALRAWRTVHLPICEVMQRATSSLRKEEKEQLRGLLERVERDVDHARVMRAWSDAEPTRVPAPNTAATDRDEKARRDAERVRRSAIHVR